MPAILAPKKCTNTRLAAVETTIAPPKAFPRFAGADARNHLVPADERADGIGAGVAEFRHEDEIEHGNISAVPTPGKKLIFWMKFSSHGTYIRPNSVVAMATMPVVLLRETNCRTHRPSTNRMMKAGFKIVHARGRAGRAEVAGQVQKGPDHEQQRRRAGRTI